MSSFKKSLFCTSALIPLLGLGLYLYSNTSAATGSVPNNCFADYMFTDPLLIPESQPVQKIKINRKHIYCGEVIPNIAKKPVAVGLHAKSASKFPDSATGKLPTVPAANNEIYTTREVAVRETLHSSFKDKDSPGTSSMFPDNCTEEQINNSIVYAYAPNTSGLSGPTPPNSKYCYALDQQFTIIIHTALKFTSQSAKNEELVINSAYPKQ
ncbi:EndoU domain-containing protein [Pseudomonas chlororaphis]|uniref:EndoU domain-containing protein n=1 Tax=Pseudomonas chlororaphis TaxID=587753 RepID=UPI002367D1BD|nr:EndoU domain-containing protein [Pseudomonas chlororaphis]WDH32851.1 EndoU domain-containing protein [Pseudomonas chlororaphis]WDH38933.1 EndoU domain-containing protein [Pseudomonas chlororaphis]